ncbi:MAG: sigma-70 family RNA polymerase sigma factor [Planctomycetes bacterium]|nr:sigma-70 family RNA polymerase sigma factor [Planctomycetota bacterium]
MDESQQFPRLMEGLRAGELWAAEELCRVYGPFLRAAVRRQLHPELRARFDSLDFVQDLWVSFLAIPRDRYSFESPNTLRQFLTQIVLNKVVDVYRQRFGSQKHDLNRELPLEEKTEGASGLEPASSDPTPSQLAVAAEEWERILNRFPSGHRAVLIRLREGHGYEDIARMTGISQSTIKRIVRRLKEVSGR